MCVGILLVRVSVHRAHTVPLEEEDSMYLLKLEVISLHVGAQNRTWGVWKSDQCY